MVIFHSYVKLPEGIMENYDVFVTRKMMGKIYGKIWRIQYNIIYLGQSTRWVETNPN